VQLETPEERDDLIEVYLLINSMQDAGEQTSFEDFFEKELSDIGRLQRCPRIFLTLQSALYYSRFLGNNYSVLRAFVPDAAIEARGNELTLKQGMVDKSHVHSCIHDVVTR